MPVQPAGAGGGRGWPGVAVAIKLPLQDSPVWFKDFVVLDVDINSSPWDAPDNPCVPLCPQLINTQSHVVSCRERRRRNSHV